MTTATLIILVALFVYTWLKLRRIGMQQEGIIQSQHELIVAQRDRIAMQHTQSAAE